MGEEPPGPKLPPNDAPRPASQPQPYRDPELLHRRLGDFEILREIGRGGMGVVYEARQISLNRPVALKVLPPALGLTPHAVLRFQREAQAAAKLHHSHIVPVHAVGEEQGCHFFAMERIDGQPLSSILDDLRGGGKGGLFDATVTGPTPGGEIPPAPASRTSEAPSPAPAKPTDSASSSRGWFDTVAKLVADVASALHYAHGQGIVHRDVKPANLMLAKDGRLCVTDFGLAHVAQEPGMTLTGSLMGTPAYMSPEQVAAGRVKVDHRTDVYSLGTVLYEMLTLRRPFGGESREEVLSAILTKEPPPPRRVNRRVPVDLETICLKAIEKDPDRRYATAGLLAEDLQAYLSRGWIAARRPGAGRRATKWVRRHPVATIATAAALVVAVAGTVAVVQALRGWHAEARRLVASAENDAREGTYREGLEKVDRALKIAPNLLEAKKTRGRLLLGVRRDRELANLAAEILDDHPDDWEAHGWLAFVGKYGRLADIPAEEHARAVERFAPDSAEAWYVKGLAAATSADAVRCFDHALERDPGHAWAMLQRGQQSMLLHDYPAAIADAERTIAVRPRSARGRRFLGLTYSRGLRDAERALAEFDKASAIDPRDPFVYYERSWVYRELQFHTQKRLADLTRAVERAPWHPGPIAERANALIQSGRHEEGLVEARRAVEIEPNWRDGYSQLLWALWNLKRTDDLRAAMADFRARADGWADPGATAEAYRDLAAYHLRLGEAEPAVAAATKAIELDPENPDGYVSRANARRRTEGQAAIDEECDRIAGLDAEEPGPLLQRARVMHSLCRRPERSMADLSRVIALAPGWPDPYSDRGDRLRAEKRYAEALVDADRAVELAPNWASAIFRRSLVHFALEHWTDALADLERGFATGAEGANWRWLQAQALAHLGREADAFAAVDKIVQAGPKGELGYWTRSILLFYLGRLDEAIEAVDQAIEVDPKRVRPYVSRALFRSFKPGACASVEQDLRKVAELEPANPDTKRNEAQLRAYLADACPESLQLERSLALAREVVKTDPKRPEFQAALGIALYRAGRFDEAASALRRSIALTTEPHPDSVDLFFLAMTEARLGRRADARRTYARAVERMNATWPKSPEYARARAEAERVLGV